MNLKDLKNLKNVRFYRNDLVILTIGTLLGWLLQIISNNYIEKYRNFGHFKILVLDRSLYSIPRVAT